jgi:hypothetical protein
MIGWIKLHRKFSEWEWYTNNVTKSVFIHLLLKANFEDKKWQGVDIHRGQLITSIKTMSVELKLSEKQIRTAIKNLISTGELASKGTNKWTMLTICKYESYQNEEETKGEQTDKPKANKGRTKGEQRATTKEEEESNNIQKRKELFRGLLDGFKEAYPQSLLDKFFDYWTEHGINDKKMRFEKERTFGIERRLSTWSANENKWKFKTTTEPMHDDLTQMDYSKPF